MQYFRIRSPRTIKNSNGVVNKRPYEVYFAKKSNVFGKRNETYIPKKASVLLLGQDGSGKSKQLHKLYSLKEKIYHRHKKNFVYINCNDSVSDWIYHNLGEYYDDYLDDDSERRSLYNKIQALVNYSEKAIVFIDDLHKASGRKLEVLKDIKRNSKSFIATATQKHHINKTLLKIMGRDYKELHLSTEAAKDATHVFLVVFLMGLVVTGNIELAMLLTAGRLMLKQNDQK